MADIRYNFVASGVGDVKGAFRDIDAAARESAKSFDRSAKGAAAGSKAAADGARSAKAPISETAKLAERVARDQEKASARAAKAQEQASAKVEKAVEKAASATEKAAKKAADAEIKEAKRAEAALIKSVEHVYQIRARYDAQQSANEAKKAAATARAQSKDDAGNVGVLRGLAGSIGLAGLGLGIAGVAAVGGAARDGMRLQEASNRLSINARGAGEKGADATALRKEFEAAAAGSPGVAAADIAEGVQGFVAKTGDLASGRKFASTFATTASATGGDVKDIANAAADISQKFDIKGVDEMRDALAALTFQGKHGAFELKDAASQFAKMSAAAQRFGLDKGVGGLKTLGGLTQIARSATGSSEQAATAVEATFRQLVAESGKLKAQGVDVFQKGSTSKTRDIRDILVDSISKLGGSLPKLQKIFGEEGIRGISPLISTFNEAKGSAKGSEAEKTAAGVEALRKALADAIDAPGDWAEVVKDAAQAQTDATAQANAAWEAFKAEASERLLPAISELLPSVTELAKEAIPRAIDVFKLLLEAATDVVAVLKWIGLIHPHEDPPAEKVRKANDALADYQTKLNGRNHLMTGDEAKEKFRLQDALAVAKEEAKAPASPEAFVEAYAKAGAGKWTDPEGQKRTAAIFAKEIQAHPEKDFTPLGENDQQTEIRERYRKSLLGDGKDGAPGKDGGGKDTGALALNEAAAKLTAAAAAMAKAAPQASIAGTHTKGTN